MAAANKGSPIQLEGPFPEGAMGPLTQRPRQLIQKPWPTFPRRVHGCIQAVSWRLLLAGCFETPRKRCE